MKKTHESPAAALERIFGYTSFRPGQEAIINALVAGFDVFAVMPTGGGKSLCYQLPAVLREGTAIVVSPLISLMKDQVDAAVENGIAAFCYNSALGPRERADVLDSMRTGSADLLYISPERFADEYFIETLRLSKISLIAIDEAHCVSEWGHDFRPDYLALSRLSTMFPGIPLAAFTATATPRVQQDIITRLNLRQPLVHRASFDRPNLFIEVLQKHDAEKQLCDFCIAHKGEQGIIYRTSRTSVEETAAMLTRSGIAARAYHAGLADEIRARNQEAFNRDEIDVIVATIAFGMGIDKSNVRFVIHGDLPKTMEGYYQEIGRAGRDGSMAHCLLLYGRGDIPRLKHFIDKVEDENERSRLNRALNAVVSYAGSAVCRRRHILSYFGETYGEENCATCDVCTGAVKSIDATVDAQKFLSAVVRTGNRFGAGYIADILMGSKAARIVEAKHDTLTCFGIGKDRSREHWLRLADELVALSALVKNDGKYTTLAITDEARPILRGESQVSMKEVAAPPAGRTRAKAAKGAPTYNSGLFEILRAERLAVARSEGLPPYIVFSDRTLQDMAAHMPRTRDAFLRINGVGARKLERYGDRFIAIVNQWCGENAIPSVTAPEPVAPPQKSSAEKTQGSSTQRTIELLRAGYTLTQAAAARNVTRGTVVGHVAEYLASGGTDIRPELCVSSSVMEAVHVAAQKAGDTRLKPIFEILEGLVSYDDIRLALGFLQNQES